MRFLILKFEEKTEGIVLRSLEYKERQRIITVFSKEAGIISLILKGLSGRNTSLLALSSPFSRAEFLYRKGTSDLLRFLDGTLFEEHLALREKLSFLQAAGSLVQAILQSQLPGKPAPALYCLLSAYLSQVPFFPDPSSLVASFHLKLLKHEGLLALSPHCSHCHTLPARFLARGESLCHTHRTSEATAFTEEEWHTLSQLLNAQHFSSMRSVQLSSTLPERIVAYFRERLHD